VVYRSVNWAGIINTPFTREFSSDISNSRTGRTPFFSPCDMMLSKFVSTQPQAVEVVVVSNPPLQGIRDYKTSKRRPWCHSKFCLCFLTLEGPIDIKRMNTDACEQRVGNFSTSKQCSIYTSDLVCIWYAGWWCSIPGSSEVTPPWCCFSGALTGPIVRAENSRRGVPISEGPLFGEVTFGDVDFARIWTRVMTS
jgi:hypothetical protein